MVALNACARFINYLLNTVSPNIVGECVFVKALFEDYAILLRTHLNGLFFRFPSDPEIEEININYEPFIP